MRTLSIILGASLAVAVGAAASPISGHAESPAATAALVSGDCVVTCTYPQCGVGQHKAYYTPQYLYDRLGHGSHSDCAAGDCGYQGTGNSAHDVCVIAFRGNTERYDNLVDAVDRNDVPGMWRLIERNPDAIEINWARSAIQVISCQGTVAINLPVTSEALTELRTLAH